MANRSQLGRWILAGLKTKGVRECHHDYLVEELDENEESSVCGCALGLGLVGKEGSWRKALSKLRKMLTTMGKDGYSAWPAHREALRELLGITDKTAAEVDEAHTDHDREARWIASRLINKKRVL